MSGIAIIGAGVAGLACARRLQDHGLAVRIFDKSRALGGRCATRRSDFGPFDHGAQYASARGGEFASALRTAAQNGDAAVWDNAALSGDKRRVGVPGMRDLAGSLAKGLTIIFDTEVTRIAGQSENWCLHAGNKNFGPFAHVVVTAPAPQTIALVQDCAPDLANALRTVRYEPCMTAMVAFDRRLDLPNCLRSEESPIA